MRDHFGYRDEYWVDINPTCNRKDNKGVICGHALLWKINRFHGSWRLYCEKCNKSENTHYKTKYELQEYVANCVRANVINTRGKEMDNPPNG